MAVVPAPRTSIARRVGRNVVVGVATGAVLASAAWASAGLVPVTADAPEAAAADLTEAVSGAIVEGGVAEGGVVDTTAPIAEAPLVDAPALVTTTDPALVRDGRATGSVGARIPDGTAVGRVGAAVVSLFPTPDADAGEVWNTEYDACSLTGLQDVERVLGGGETPLTHLAVAGTPWPENPNCIYMGGYGLGPLFPITSIDEVHGLHVRATAVLDDQGDAAVLVQVDGEGWFWDYASKCDDCGAKQISERLGAELGIDPAGIVIASSHSHTSPDFIGGWGFVPDWYMTQATNAIEQAVRTSVATAQPAVVALGEELAREFNRDRRDTYRSAEEQQMTWLRGLAVTETADGWHYLTDDERGTPATIATVGAYAAHPVTQDHEDGHAHADWPALFAARSEDRFGGVGMSLMTGLGKLSPSGGVAIGTHLADRLPDGTPATLLADLDVVAARTTIRHPATNVPLTGLGAPGFFDRQFDAVPAQVRTGPSPDEAPCASASAYSVDLPVAAIRIGSALAITTAPGEVFANLTNTLKEKSGALVTMPLGQANDALGYMPQSFELNRVGNQGLGFVAGGIAVVNYEDSYAIDACVGDHVLETTLDLLAATNS